MVVRVSDRLSLEVLRAAYHTGDGVGTTLDLDRSPQMGSA